MVLKLDEFARAALAMGFEDTATLVGAMAELDAESGLREMKELDAMHRRNVEAAV